MVILSKMSSKANVVAIWQPVGYSTYQITNSLALKYRTKATHTGVIDPLAEGVVLVLLGEDRYSKNEHSEWLKEYEFDMTFGISTDSLDALGIAQKIDFSKNPDRTQVEQVISKFIGLYAQKVPLYSAQKVQGKRLYMYPMHGQTPPEIPEKIGKIHNLEVVDYSTSSLHDKVKEMITKVEQVKTGEFRQQEIIRKWNEFLANNSDCDIISVRFRVLMTRGLYVRSLCGDISKQLGVPAFVSKLVRTKNGPYAQEKCNSIIKLFGDKFDHNMLTSKYASMIKL